MKITKNEFDETIKMIQENFEKYQKGHYDTKSYTYFLANGDRLDYRIKGSFIPHLLGIDTTYLLSTGLFREKDSFTLLNNLIDSSYKIYTSINNGRLDYDRLFSRYVKEKNEIFNENIIPKVDDVSFVCKYNKERTYGFSEYSNDCDYIIGRELPTGEFLLLMLYKDNDGKYIPRSSQILKTDREKEEKLSTLLYNQDITFITGFMFHDHLTDYNSKTYFFNNKNKSNKITDIRAKYSKYNTTIDVSGDYSFYINKIAKEYQEQKIATNILELISEIMRKRNVVDLDQLDDSCVLDEKVVQILTAYNDSLCNTEKNENASLTYTSIKDENGSLKKELEAMRNTLTTLQQINTNQENKIGSLENENEGMQKKLTIITNVINN